MTFGFLVLKTDVIHLHPSFKHKINSGWLQLVEETRKSPLSFCSFDWKVIIGDYYSSSQLLQIKQNACIKNEQPHPKPKKAKEKMQILLHV